MFEERSVISNVTKKMTAFRGACLLGKNVEHHYGLYHKNLFGGY
jgi:hypothetical protein